MIYRKATEKDIDSIVEMRINLLIEEAATIPTDIRAELKEYFSIEINKTIVVMLAEEKDKIVATSSVIFQKYPPSFSNKEGMRAYITNVYTMPEYRRQGISTKLLDELIEEVEKRGISYVWLWATEQGNHLYKKYGFEELKAFSTMDYVL